MPRLSDEIRRDLFFSSLKKRLVHLYSCDESSANQKPLIQAGVEGFFESAICMKIVTRDEVQKVIDDTHLKIYGMSRSERQKVTNASGDRSDPDYSIYDTPPSARKN